MRPIDADALNQSIKESFDLSNIAYEETTDAFEKEIYKMQLMVFAECGCRVKEAHTLGDLRPKGRWNIVEIDKDSRRITIECSECGMVEEMTVMAYGFGHNFCHICGADMRGGGEE